MTVQFNFGGFYNSFYDGAIDDVIYEDNDENTIDPDSIDFKALHIAVAKRIVEQFNEYISNEFDVEVDLKFECLRSPKYYNFGTDVIDVIISDEDKIKLDLLVANDSDVEDILKGVVKDATTSRDGYIPFYEYDEVMAKIDDKNTEVYYQSLLDALMDYNKDEYNNITLDCLNETISCNI